MDCLFALGRIHGVKAKVLYQLVTNMFCQQRIDIHGAEFRQHSLCGNLHTVFAVGDLAGD